MTEDEARQWVRDRFGVSHEALCRRFVELVVAESGRQNLIAESSKPAIWVRHVADSAQLVQLAAQYPGHWVDIGSGAGFPGMVVALLSERAVTLIEPRRKRAEFLDHAVKMLGLTGRIAVYARKVENVELTGCAVISARAVAALDTLFHRAIHLADRDTVWILPKGRGGKTELDEARRTWHGEFHVEHSLTDPESSIVLARHVRRR